MALSVPAPSRAGVSDVVLSALIATALVVLSGHIPAGAHSRPIDAIGIGLLLLAGVAMGVCRRWPRLATAVVTVVLCAFVARNYPNNPVWVTGWVVLVVLAWRTDRRTAVAGTVGMMTALSAAAVAVGRGGLLEPALYIGWSGAAIFLGEALRSRRRYLDERRERAAATERSREEEFARRLVEDRLRIARDLHDSVAHAMATINVQAAAAAHVVARRPEAAGEALAVIQRASGEVLDGLTVMLSVLREDGSAADRLPTPGIRDLARLVDGTTESGLAVTLDLDAPPQQIPASVSTAAYRVVQESLTNVLRHSVARTVTVSLTARPGAEIDLRIVDSGPPRPGPATGTGVGIRGMRERVTSTGGTFLAGATPGGGFAVSARWRRGR